MWWGGGGEEEGGRRGWWGGLVGGGGGGGGGKGERDFISLFGVCLAFHSARPRVSQETRVNWRAGEFYTQLTGSPTWLHIHADKTTCCIRITFTDTHTQSLTARR